MIIAGICILLGLFFNIYKSEFSWFFWLISGVIGVLYAATYYNYKLGIFSCIFIAFCIFGIIKWLDE